MKCKNCEKEASIEIVKDSSSKNKSTGVIDKSGVWTGLMVLDCVRNHFPFF